MKIWTPYHFVIEISSLQDLWCLYSHHLKISIFSWIYCHDCAYWLSVSNDLLIQCALLEQIYKQKCHLISSLFIFSARHVSVQRNQHQTCIMHLTKVRCSLKIHLACFPSFAYHTSSPNLLDNPKSLPYRRWHIFCTKVRDFIILSNKQFYYMMFAGKY